ncbi:antirestriction protein ArdA [Aliikangiella sp. IMCC44359]|uniref:antirestriction protein ArdA n=1 Tax=Aliikangiella sp. IMCC44359 TaxID=3459125 RepID=UPI00403AC738
MSDIRIYVACLAAYNAGHLHGVWIDACGELEAIQEQVKQMLSSSPVEDAEEYAIHDYEGYGAYRLSEYDGLDTAHEVACFIEEHGSLGAEILNYTDGDFDDAKRLIEDNYHGCFESLADYAQDYTESTGSVPQHLEFYIDYEKMGRDFELSGDIFTIETAHNEVHIFSSY